VELSEPAERKKENRKTYLNAKEIFIHIACPEAVPT
jgi:hypothetical protein